MLGHSQFFSDKIEKMTEFGNSLNFDYTNYSRGCVKLFLDSLHLIQPGQVDVATIAECVDFCQFEGKTTFEESFEVDLVERLMVPIMKSTLPLGTELLISAYFAKVDNFRDSFQQKVAEKLTRETVSALVYDFDMDNALNKRLIKMCVQTKVFADDSKQSVVFTLLMYGKELQEFQAGVEDLTIEDDYIPDARSARLGMKFRVPYLSNF